MKKKLLALFMGTGLVLAACGGGGDKAAEEPKKDEGGGATATAANGEELYKGTCAGCHGQNLEGNVGPALDKVGAKLSAAEIEGIILNGQGTMTAGLLTGDDAKAVSEWLATKK